MTLTAKDIQSQQFHVRFRGFDVEEVDDFLEKIAGAMEATNQENAKLKTRLDDLEKELAAYQSQEKSFQAAIIAAQRIAEEMKEKSRQEAEETVARAREEAAKLQQEATEEVAGLEHDVDHLKELRVKVQEEMRQFLLSYLNQLESEPTKKSVPGQAPEEPATSRLTEANEQFDQDLADDLYVKIDLPDDAMPVSEENLEPPEVQLPSMPETNLLDMEEDEEQLASRLPELEDDMVFSLEDPLDADDQEPAVILGDEEDDDQRKAG
jgi:cell division initiation protein